MNVYPAVASGGGGALTTAQAAIAADVTITPINTFVDGPTLSLAAGTWYVCAQTSIAINAGGAMKPTLRIWDGTTTYAESEDSRSSTAAAIFPFALATVIVLAAATTIKLSAAVTSIGSVPVLKADPLDNSSGGHKTTQITAVKVG